MTLPALTPSEQRRRHHLGPPLCGHDLTVMRCGLGYAMPPGLVERPSGTGDWLFMIFHDAVRIGAADGCVEHQPTSLVAWAPGTAHRYGNPDRRWRHSWLHSTGPLADRAGRQLGSNRVHRIVDTEAVDRRLTALSDQILADPDPQLAGFAAAALLHVLIRQCAPTAPPMPAWLATAKSLLDDGFSEPLAIASIAARVGRTPTHLCAAFRAAFGQSPKQYLVARRLDEAAYLLRQAGPTISDVAASCGFSDVPHFTRLFRRRFNRPPGAHRRLR